MKSSYLEQVLAALPHVLSKHRCVEGFGLILQQPALVSGLVCCQIFEVWPSVALWIGRHTHTHTHTHTHQIPSASYLSELDIQSNF